MLNLLKKTIFVLLIISFYCIGYCSDLKIFTEAREVELNKSFNLIVEVNENITDFKMPKIPDFIVILKGSHKKNDRIVYNYELSPKAEGIFTIPAITCGQSTTIPISIRVYKKQATKDKKYSYKDSNSIANAVVDTKIVYVNQVLYYTLKFRTNRDLKGNPSYILPMFQDFWKSKSKNKSGYRLINGENYFTFEVTTPLYPIREGVITIDPSSVTIQYLNSYMDSKFETEKVNIKVLPLPEFGKPDFFSGSVGRYDIAANVSKKNLKVNEPLVLTITIRGNGNINSVSEPKINLSNDIKKYSTTIKTKTDDFISSKEFQCVLIPLIEGEKIIPEITFAYFDPDMKEYKEISTKKIIINVSGEKNTENIESIEDVLEKTNKEDIKETDDTLKELILKTNLDTSKDNNMLIKNKFLMFLAVLLVLVIFVALIYRFRLIVISKDVVRVQKMKYNKLFIKYFKQSQSALNRYIQFNFYYNLDLALKMLLSSKTNYNYTFMTKDEIKNNLCSLKFNEQIINNIMKILVDCNKFKFTYFRATQKEMSVAFSQLKLIKEQLDKML